MLNAVWPIVTGEFAGRHGPPPGGGAVVVAMGKLGSREMTVSSDLDLIVIYDAEGAEASKGKRPLAVGVYYARLTQALISALSAPMPEGVLYKVDMRLRPSGRQGPVATALSAFRRYQAEEAWTWEHLALTRARVVAGPAGLREATAEAIAAVLHAPHDAAQVLADAADMRRRLAEAHEQAAANPWEVKLGPGRMMDIELLAQTGALVNNLGGLRSPRRMLRKLGSLGWISGEEAAALETALARLAALQQVGRIASDRTVDPAVGGAGLVRLVLATTDAPDLDALRAYARRRGRTQRGDHRRPSGARLMLPIVFHPDYVAPLRPGHPLPDVEIRLPARGACRARDPAHARRLPCPGPREPRPGRGGARAGLRGARRQPDPFPDRVARHRPAQHRRRRPPRLSFRRRHAARRPARDRERPRLQHGRRLASRRPGGRRGISAC